MSFIQIPLFANNDVGDQEKLNNIIKNQEFLNSARVTLSFNAYGVQQSDQLKIAVGTTDCNNPNAGWRTRWISSGNFFTPGTRPVGFADYASLKQRRVTTAIARRTGGTSILDHTGLQCHVNYVGNTTTKLIGPNYINWMMVGY